MSYYVCDLQGQSCLWCVRSLWLFLLFFFQAEDGIRDLVRSRGLGDVYKRQVPDQRPHTQHALAHGTRNLGPT